MRSYAVVVLGTLVAIAVPGSLHAQGRGHGKEHVEEVRMRHGPPIHLEGDRVRLGDGRIVVLRDGRHVSRDRRIVVRGRDGRVIVIGDGEVERRFATRRGAGPKFCRTGAGHPVFGPAWCLEKGFGLGNGGDVYFDRDRGRIVFYQDGRAVFVRNRRYGRDLSLWDQVLGAILTWAD